MSLFLFRLWACLSAKALAHVCWSLSWFYELIYALLLDPEKNFQRSKSRCQILRHLRGKPPPVLCFSKRHCLLSFVQLYEWVDTGFVLFLSFLAMKLASSHDAIYHRLFYFQQWAYPTVPDSGTLSILLSKSLSGFLFGFLSFLSTIERIIRKSGLLIGLASILLDTTLCGLSRSSAVLAVCEPASVFLTDQEIIS